MTDMQKPAEPPQTPQEIWKAAKPQPVKTRKWDNMSPGKRSMFVATITVEAAIALIVGYLALQPPSDEPTVNSEPFTPSQTRALADQLGGEGTYIQLAAASNYPAAFDDAEGGIVTVSKNNIPVREILNFDTPSQPTKAGLHVNVEIDRFDPAQPPVLRFTTSSLFMPFAPDGGFARSIDTGLGPKTLGDMRTTLFGGLKPAVDELLKRAVADGVITESERPIIRFEPSASTLDTQATP